MHNRLGAASGKMEKGPKKELSARAPFVFRVVAISLARTPGARSQRTLGAPAQAGRAGGGRAGVEAVDGGAAA